MIDLSRQLFFVLCIAGAVIAAAVAGCAQHTSTMQDKALIDLGSTIFHDASLSVDGSVSCASCHRPTRHFTDARVTSTGARRMVSTRNAPSLLDVSLVTGFFWDGRETQLEDVVLQPFTNPVEMGLPDHDALVERASGKFDYQQLTKNAFGDPAINADRIAQALAAYLRALPVDPTRFDLYTQSNGKSGLSDDEIAGLSLFEGKAGCTDCHSQDGSLAPLTDNRYHHSGIGFEKVAGNISKMVERLDGIKQQGLPLGQAILVDDDIAQLGRFATTRRPGDLGAFRTPSLRNVARTAPYMHDGSVATLEEAVEREIYYRSLARGRPISLTVEEQSQLIAFLKALNTVSTVSAVTGNGSIKTAPMDSANR